MFSSSHFHSKIHFFPKKSFCSPKFPQRHCIAIIIDEQYLQVSQNGATQIAKWDENNFHGGWTKNFIFHVHCTIHSIESSWFSTLYRTEKIHVDLSPEQNEPSQDHHFPPEDKMHSTIKQMTTKIKIYFFNILDA